MCAGSDEGAFAWLTLTLKLAAELIICMHTYMCTACRTSDPVQILHVLSAQTLQELHCKGRLFLCPLESASAVQPAETDDELAKGEALVEALTTFCNVVRKTPRSAPEDQELLSSAGKLRMEHIIPIYRVTPLLSLTCRAAVLRCIAVSCARLHTMLSTQGALHPSMQPRPQSDYSMDSLGPPR